MTRSRAPLVGLVVVLLVAAALAVWLLLPDDGDGAGDGAGAADDPAVVLDLEATATESPGRCMQVTPETLRNTDLAFDGTVTAADGSAVVLEVSTWFFGGEADEVRLSPPPSAGRSPLRLHGQPDFEVGQRWLVSATDGRVNVCGFTVPWTEERAEVYQASAARP